MKLLIVQRKVECTPDLLNRIKYYFEVDGASACLKEVTSFLTFIPRWSVVRAFLQPKIREETE